jgi:hypothetical protein
MRHHPTDRSGRSGADGGGDIRIAHYATRRDRFDYGDHAAHEVGGNVRSCVHKSSVHLSGVH